MISTEERRQAGKYSNIRGTREVIRPEKLRFRPCVGILAGELHTGQREIPYGEGIMRSTMTALLIVIAGLVTGGCSKKTEEKKGDTAWKTLPIRARLERRFVWFYTEITYRERYLKWNPFGLVPLAEYVSAAELARSMSFAPAGRTPNRDDSLAREKVGRKWTEWMYRDMFEAYYAEFVKGVRTLNDPSLTPVTVAAHREEIYRKCEKWWASTGAMDTIGAVIQSIFRNPVTTAAIQSNARGFALHNARLALVARVMGKMKQVNIEMPGVLIDSNAPNVDKNRGSWKAVSDMSYAADYELWMTSRVVNWWVVLLTAVAIVAGIRFIFVPPARGQ